MNAASAAQRAAQARAYLPLLRESFAHAPRYQDGLAMWWANMQLDERRLLLAHAGYDDSEEAARRPWPQILQEQRDSMVKDLKRLRTLLEGLKWF